MKFQIYGSGCAKCQQLTNNAEVAAKHLGMTFELEKVTDINAIINAGIMRTPALAVDGKVLVEGKVVSTQELEKLLS